MSKEQKHKPRIEKTIEFPRWEFIERYSLHIVIVLTIIGTLIRLYRVDYLSLWVDEYIHSSRAEGVLAGKPLFADENNGIFLTVLVILSYKIFGLSDFAARLPSVILGGLCIPAIYYFGKRFFNQYVGVIAAFLATFSVYSVFWSRVCRNYSSFEFFYLILLIIFWLAFESENDGQEKSENWFTKNNLNKKYLLLLPIALIVSMLTHQLTVFFLFSLIFYSLLMAGWKMWKKEPDRYTNKYAILFYPSLLFIILFFTPLLAEIARPILRLLLPENIVTWVIPRWDLIGNQWNSPDQFKTFNIYVDVIKNDFSNYWYIGFLGLAGIILANRKIGIFFISFFIVPTFLMSFVFFDPATPRYLLYIYPFFLLSLAYGIYFILSFVGKKILSAQYLERANVHTITLSTVVILLFVYSPYDEISALIKTNHHGQVAKNELSSPWNFSNWKEACTFVLPQLQSSDVVMSTMQNATNRYLHRDNSIYFRQMHFDAKVKKFVPNEHTTSSVASAWNYEEFLETVNKSKRGWLIADYYLYNVMTDQRARQYVLQNMKFYLDACADGSVQVFSWDNEKPEPQKDFMFELGKSTNATPQIPLMIASLEKSLTVTLAVDCEGIDDEQEAILAINGKTMLLPKCRGTQRETDTVLVEKSYFRQGQNVVQFGYNVDNPMDERKGFAVYGVKQIQPLH